MFISQALAAPAAAAPATQDPLIGFLPMIVIFVLFYFMLIRPQMKRAKEQRTMITALQKGDEVVTSGGLLGKITKVSDHYVTIEIAPNVNIPVQKQAIQTLLPKGSIKTIGQ